jgi:hypothetical protein
LVAKDAKLRSGGGHASIALTLASVAAARSLQTVVLGAGLSESSGLGLHANSASVNKWTGVDVNRGGELEVRSNSVSLREEEVEVVRAAFHHAECCSVRVEVERGSRSRAVHTADIHRELIVDENPDVVVASEVEDLSSKVSENAVPLEGLRSR